MTEVQTYTGRMVDILAPQPDEILIEDIAHALANQCRFNSHTSRYYSVAQHSILVSDLAEELTENKQAALYALLHDAHEAYLGDVVRPVRGQLKNYDKLAATMQHAIDACSDIWIDFRWSPLATEALDQLIKACDDIALATEARDLMPGGPWVDQIDAQPMTRIISPVSPDIAKIMFLRRFDELTAGDQQPGASNQ